MYAIDISNLHYRFVRSFRNTYVDVKINHSTPMLQKIPSKSSAIVILIRFYRLKFAILFKNLDSKR